MRCCAPAAISTARAFFVLAVYRRRATPEAVITDKHPAYVRALRDEVPGAAHCQSGLHRASGPDTKPIERSHVAAKDRLRPMRGLQSIRTGQRAIEGVELARAIQRGHVVAPPDAGAGGGTVYPRACTRRRDDLPVARGQPARRGLTDARREQHPGSTRYRAPQPTRTSRSRL